MSSPMQKHFTSNQTYRQLLNYTKYLITMAFVVMLWACSQNIKQGRQTQQNTAPPKIKKFYDISYHDTLRPGTNPKQLGDERFSPGENVLVQGKHLTNAKVTVDGLEANVISSHYKRLIFQVPSQLDMLENHVAKIQNAYGSTTFEFTSNHYIVGTDTDGNRHYLMRSNPKVDGYIEKDRLEIEQTRPMFNAITHQGSILYGIGVKSKTPLSEDSSNHKYTLELKVIHLNTPNEPTQASSATAFLHSPPVAIDTDQSHLAVILGKQDFALLDISQPLQTKQITHHKLPLNPDKTVYLDALLLNNNQHLAILETYQNKVLLYDITQVNEPKLIEETILLPGIDTAYSVDLVRHPSQDTQFWVLTGNNLRDFSSRAKNKIKAFLKKESKENVTRKNAALIPVHIQDTTLQLQDVITLPDRINPFFGTHDGENSIYVSSVHSDFYQAFLEEKNWLKKIGKLIFRSVKFGKIFRVDLSTGHSEIAAEGLGIYFHIAHSNSFGPVFTLAKLKGTIMAPYVKPAWGIGLQSRGTYALRKMSIKALYPPYSLGHISIQR